jgi:regulator of RNase E activity RraA
MNAFDPRDLLSKVRPASVIDAMGRRFQHKAHILDLVSPTPEKTLFGSALTISFLPYRQDLYDSKRNFGNLFYEAIGSDAENRVLVMAANGYSDTSVAGGIKLSRLQNHRMAGVLTDGRVRHFDQLKEYDFVTFCRAEAVRWGGDSIMPFLVNVPVSLGGVTIVPGDYVYADKSGVAIIPESALQPVLE